MTRHQQMRTECPSPGHARKDGFYRGLHNHHFETRTYATGAEYLAWFAGWKAGQAERKAREQRRAA